MKLKTFSLVIDEYGQIDDAEMVAALETCEVLQVWERFLEEERVWLVMVSYRDHAQRTSSDKDKFEKRNRRRAARQKILESLDPLWQPISLL